jgi:hypothetical protein
MISVKAALFVVAFFPFKIPVFAKNHEPVQTLMMYLAPGACPLRNSTMESATFCKAAYAPAPHAHF